MEKTITKQAMRDLRKELGYTQQEMADYLGLSVWTIRSYEQDKNSHNIPRRLLSDPRTKHLAK